MGQDIEKKRAYNREYSKVWHIKNAEYAKKRRAANYQKNREKELAGMKKWAENNKDVKNAINRRWKANNQGYMNKYFRERRKHDPIFKASAYLRNRIGKFLKSRDLNKCSNLKDYLGCSGEYLVAHLECQFKPGMTWENQGDWHIDHIVPLSSASTVEEVYKLSHYSNLQPLWATENIAKGAKIPK